MKLMILSFLIAFAGQASASEIILKCSNDQRPVDGLLKEVVITKSTNGNYTYSLLVEGFTRNGPLKIETKIKQSNCVFTDIQGIAECSDTHGANKLKVGLIFMDSGYQIQASNYVTLENGNQTISQEIFFDTQSCPILL